MNTEIKKFGLATTVVGSYPSTTIYEALLAQSNAKIHFPSTGQPYSSLKGMSLPYIEAMQGIKSRKFLNQEIIQVTGKIQPMNKTKMENCQILKEVKDSIKWLEENKPQGVVGLKAIITGPNTILHEILPFALGPYKDKFDILNDIALALSAIANVMLDCGAKIVQIDEPVLSRFARIAEHQGNADELAKEISEVSKVTTAIKSKHPDALISLHVCGRITKNLFEKLSNKLPQIDIFDHEFFGFPNNFDSIQEGDLKNRYIAIGVVSNVTPPVESLGDVLAVIERAARQYGPEKILLKPDCGLRRLPPEIADQKLKRITEAREKYLALHP
jgi:methionine synthase II (cobalamin-independent)